MSKYESGTVVVARLGADLKERLKERAREQTIYVLPKARPKAVERARRTWPESRAGDFELAADRKTYVDRATGTAYRRMPGDPLLGGANREDVETFCVVDGLILYLRRVGNPAASFRRRSP